MSKTSAGLIMYRKGPNGPEVLLAHPGGPFFAKKDDGAWDIPKGELNGDEDVLAAAKREFSEETGLDAPDALIGLGSVTNKSGKTIHAWAFQGDCDPVGLRSNTFTMEWPPRSGNRQEYPEADRFGFFGIEEAKVKLNPALAEFMDRLMAKI